MPGPDDLQQLRARMDALQERLLAVLHERAALAREIGRCKRSHDLPLRDPARERALLADALADLPAEGFSQAQLTRILEQVLAASRDLVAAPERP